MWEGESWEKGGGVGVGMREEEGEQRICGWRGEIGPGL